MNKIKEGVDVDSAFLKNFMMDAIKNPKKFYAVLTLAGINSVEATKIIYNLKHPRLTSSNFATKMKMLALLQNIIELITHDRILYSRVRSMAMSGDFGRIAKNVINPDKIRKHPKGRLNIVDEDAATSIGNAEIAFVARSSENPPAPLRGVPVRKRNIPKNIMDRLKDLFRKETKKPKGGKLNIVTHMGQ
jgi:hypothetical protein